MSKPIDLELLELALWNAYSIHAQKPSNRAMRCPTREDTAECATALKAVRNSYGLILAGESKKSYPTIKAEVLDSLREERGWTLATRNLHSSAIGTYTSWDRGRLTIRPDTRQQLTTIRAVGLAIQEEYNA